MTNRSTRTTMRRLASTAAYLGLVLVALGWWSYLRPAALGGSTTYVIVSGHSMEPTYESGDLVVVRRQDRYEVGDVVAFRSTDAADREGPMVIHRVVGSEPDGRLVLQGDNNEWIDPWRPTPDEVVGARAWELAGMGARVQAVVANPVIPGAALAGLAAAMTMFRRPRSERKRKTDRRPGGDPGHGRSRDRQRSPSPPEAAAVGAMHLWRCVGGLLLALILAGTSGGLTGGSAARVHVDAGVWQGISSAVDAVLPPQTEGGPGTLAIGGGGEVFDSAATHAVPLVAP